jgi:hypothetical protein
MAIPAHRDLLPASEAVSAATVARARNTLRYGVFGELETTGDTIQRIVEAVPQAIAAGIPSSAFVFVPLALGETAHARDTEIARVHSAELADRATCHRTVPVDGSSYTFISTRLMQDRFALAFELFINVGHQFVDTLAETGKPLPPRFNALLWQQALAEVRGETSQDAYESRKRAVELSRDRSIHPDLASPANASNANTSHADTLGEQASSTDASYAHSLNAPALDAHARDAKAPDTCTDAPDFVPGSFEVPSVDPPLPKAAEEQQSRFFAAAFADTLAIYMLSLAIDLDYADLREREYPLLAAPALADRLRLIADIYPPPPGYDFAIKYRRRH